MDDVIMLITQTFEKDAYGVDKPTRTYRQAFCQVRSITRAEFFSAGRNGLNPSYMFQVFAGDYSGEALVEYDGASYAVYRTYRPAGSDYVELYVQREGGANGAESDG